MESKRKEILAQLNNLPNKMTEDKNLRMESELLPCPFCGEEAKEISENHMLAIQCMTCECRTDYFPSFKIAADIWNTRTNKERTNGNVE